MTFKFFDPFQPIIAGCFFFLAAYACMRRKPDLLLALSLTALGFGNFWVVFLGSICLPHKIVGLWSLAYVLLQAQTWSRPLTGAKRHQLIIIFLWFLLACLLAYSLPLPPAAVNSSGTQGASFRPLVQLVGYMSALSLVPLSFAAARVPGGMTRVLGIYAAAVLVVCIIAVYQYIVLKMGLPFMPIYRPDGGHSELAAFGIGGEVVARLYSVAGEPKQLGVFLTPFVVMGISLSFESRRRWPLWWNRRSVFALAAIVDVLTYSTAVLLALGIATLLAVFWNLRGYIRALASVLALVGMTGAMALSPDKARAPVKQTTGLDEVFYTRTIGRLQVEGANRPEAQVLRKLTIDFPEYFPIGFGLGMAAYYIEGFYLGEGGVEPIDLGWITLLTDFGAIGVALILFAVYKGASPLLRAALAASPRDALIFRGAAGALIGSCAAHLGTGSFVPMMIFLGINLAMRGFILNMEPPRRAEAPKIPEWKRIVPGGGLPVRQANRGF